VEKIVISLLLAPTTVCVLLLRPKPPHHTQPRAIDEQPWLPRSW
jgi:hypothetical protein